MAPASKDASDWAALEAIRRTIRDTCSQDQCTWDQSWKSLLADTSLSRNGHLPVHLVQQTLTLNAVSLTRTALRALLERFQGAPVLLSPSAIEPPVPVPTMQVPSFLRWIALSPPSDHVDPELVFARLPQPYRRIQKVLETTILDTAWDCIVAKSAKYKLEMAAALSARTYRQAIASGRTRLDTTRSAVAAAVAGEGGGAEDYEAARKRCCLTRHTLTSHALRLDVRTPPARILAMTSHDTEPWVLLVVEEAVGVDAKASGDCASLGLRLVHTRCGAGGAQETIMASGMLRPQTKRDRESATDTDTKGEQDVPYRMRYEIAGLTRLESRTSRRSTKKEEDDKEAEFDAPATAVVTVAIHLTETRMTTSTSASDPAPRSPEAGEAGASSKAEEEDVLPTTTTTTEKVLVYDFFIGSTASPAASSSSGPSEPRLIASFAFSSLDQRVTSLQLAFDASRLAIATSTNQTDIYHLPEPGALPLTTSAEEASPDKPDQSTEPLVLLASVTTAAPVSAIYFLHSPLTHTVLPLSRAQARRVTHTYAIALIADTSLFKCVLPSLSAATAEATAPVLLSASSQCAWSHLEAISCSSADVTTQFLAMGLQDGTAVVWDMLEEYDYAVIGAVCALKPRAVSGGQATSALDAVVLSNGMQTVVTYSKGTQQICFYDLTDRATPMLLRIVTPPLPPPSASKAITSPVGEAAPSNRVQFTGLSPHAHTDPALDLPVVIAAYSNGYALLYDTRSGAAMGSFRIRKAVTVVGTATRSQTLLLSANPVSIATVAPAVESASSKEMVVHIYDWAQLLTTCSPSLSSSLTQHYHVAPSCSNLKRLFLKHAFGGGHDTITMATTTASSTPTPTTQSLHALLLRSCSARPSERSLPLATTPYYQVDSGLGSPTSWLPSSQGTGPTPLHASMPSTSASSSSIASSPDPRAVMLPVLPDLVPCPLKPTVAARFEQAIQLDEQRLAEAAERDRRMHRRRQDLLKRAP